MSFRRDTGEVSGGLRRTWLAQLCFCMCVCPHHPYTPHPRPFQIIEKQPGHIRSRVFREVEMLYQCQGHR